MVPSIHATLPQNVVNYLKNKKIPVPDKDTEKEGTQIELEDGITQEGDSFKINGQTFDSSQLLGLNGTDEYIAKVGQLINDGKLSINDTKELSEAKKPTEIVIPEDQSLTVKTAKEAFARFLGFNGEKDPNFKRWFKEHEEGGFTYDEVKEIMKKHDIILTKDAWRKVCCGKWSKHFLGFGEEPVLNLNWDEKNKDNNIIFQRWGMFETMAMQELIKKGASQFSDEVIRNMTLKIAKQYFAYDKFYIVDDITEAIGDDGFKAMSARDHPYFHVYAAVAWDTNTQEPINPKNLSPDQKRNIAFALWLEWEGELPENVKTRRPNKDMEKIAKEIAKEKKEAEKGTQRRLHDEVKRLILSKETNGFHASYVLNGEKLDESTLGKINPFNDDPLEKLVKGIATGKSEKDKKELVDDIRSQLKQKQGDYEDLLKDYKSDRFVREALRKVIEDYARKEPGERTFGKNEDEDQTDKTIHDAWREEAYKVQVSEVVNVKIETMPEVFGEEYKNAIAFIEGKLSAWEKADLKDLTAEQIKEIEKYKDDVKSEYLKVLLKQMWLEEKITKLRDPEEKYSGGAYVVTDGKERVSLAEKNQRIIEAVKKKVEEDISTDFKSKGTYGLSEGVRTKALKYVLKDGVKWDKWLNKLIEYGDVITAPVGEQVEDKSGA